jgi:hypothetical protein
MGSDAPIYRTEFASADVKLDAYLGSTCYKYSFSRTKRLLNIKKCIGLMQLQPLMRRL